MTLWSIPIALGVLAGFLALASHLESSRVRTLVRLTVKSQGTTPEVAEALIAAELAPVLSAHGLTKPASA